MKAEDPRAERWRELTVQALYEAGLNQTDLANALGYTRAMVSHWLADNTRYGPPDPDVVFAIEDLLGCRNMLARALGYQRADDIVPSVETAVQNDPGLTGDQKELLAVQLASMRQAAQARRTQRSPRRS